MSEKLPPSILNSPWSFLPDNLMSWLVVCIVLFLMSYTAYVIANEKTKFEEEGQWVNWNGLKLFIPSWWTKKNSDHKKLTFVRTDTHYDWYFEVSFDECSNSLEDFRNQYLNLNEIILDLDEAMITTQKNYLFIQEEFLNRISDFYRIESTGTQHQEERIYLDATWIKTNEGKIYQFISRSSVLNGGIEGPYAEEVLKRLNFS